MNRELVFGIAFCLLLIQHFWLVTEQRSVVTLFTSTKKLTTKIANLYNEQVVQ